MPEKDCEGEPQSMSFEEALAAQEYFDNAQGQPDDASDDEVSEDGICAQEHKRRRLDGKTNPERAFVTPPGHCTRNLTG